MISSALIIQPLLDRLSKSVDGAHQLSEAEGLVRAIHIDVCKLDTIPLSKINPGRFFGKGTIERLSQDISQLKPTIVFVNHALSPVQQRNLEKEWKVKVIDRTGLILEIFGARAQTKEGRIQVELATLEYQRSRLVKSWTHLERQRGGTSFIGGPGESQLEIDRRLIGERIAHLKKELVKVRKTRDLGRKSRERVPYPIIALVGYTNAGKSTLFNRLTGAGVFAEDLPFATLDPTMRQLTLPSGRDIILSDTVGFISNLPTHLVESFRATLEQIEYADIILHVRDATQPNFDRHKHDVLKILEDLGVSSERGDRVYEIINKMDACSAHRREEIVRNHKFNKRLLPISAATGAGISTLLELMDDFLSRQSITMSFSIPAHDGKALAWLHSHGQVLLRDDQEEGVLLSVCLDISVKNRFESQFGYQGKPQEKDDNASSRS